MTLKNHFRIIQRHHDAYGIQTAMQASQPQFAGVNSINDVIIKRTHDPHHSQSPGISRITLRKEYEK